MKTKGISFWEQHIERFVLGLAAVVCLALVALQFLGEPNAVQVAGKSISPGEVDEQLQAKAQEVDQKLGEDRTYDFGTVADPVAPRFEERLNTPVAPAPRMFVSAPTLDLGGKITPTDREWRTVQVPTPTGLAVQQHFDTIQPEVVDATPALQAVLGTGAPYDKTWNTFSAKFDVAGLLKQYTEDGPNGEAAYLLAWHNNRVDFIDLKVEREEYVDGAWKDLKVIDPMPGYFSFRAELSGKTVDDALRTSTLQNAADPAVRAQIIQPPFYATLTESWTPPGGKQAEGNVAPDDPAADLKAEREEVQRRLDLVIKNLKNLGCPETPPAPSEPEKPSTTPRAGGGARGAGGGGGGAAPPGGDMGTTGAGQGGALRSGDNKAADISRCKAAWNRKKQLQTQLEKLDAKIAEITGKAAEQPKEEAEAEEPETIIDIWAHDLDVQPGKTYRYRMTVEVYNPLFGRKLDLIPAQQPLAEKFTIFSEASEWSEPLTAQPPLRMFVTSALPSNPTALGMALGQANAEVYRFHNGRWWLESFTVKPGDRIGDTKTSRDGAAVDYGTEWFVLDIVPTLGVDATDSKQGYGATVMLQNLSDPSKIEWRAPRDDLSDAERRSLNRRVKLSDLDGDAVASASGDRNAGDTGPTN